MTTEANGCVSEVHDRRPVLLDDEGVEYSNYKGMAK
jgi:putative SOS response-associated peptidase YedK